MNVCVLGAQEVGTSSEKNKQQALANPTVASATSAAMGTLTPMPCIPVLTAPWAPPGMEMVSNQPALLDNAQLFCAYGGQITIKNPGQQSTSE